MDLTALLVPIGRVLAVGLTLSEETDCDIDRGTGTELPLRILDLPHVYPPKDTKMSSFTEFLAYI